MFNVTKKRIFGVVLVIVLIVIISGIVVIRRKYLSLERSETLPLRQSQEKIEVVNWSEYKWGSLKFKYPADWKVETTETSIVLIPPEETSSFLMPLALAIDDNRIMIGGEKTCLTVGKQYHCEVVFGLPIYTASNNPKIVAIFDEIVKSATLIVLTRDSETNIAVEATYFVNGKSYNEEELNRWLKKAPRGRYDVSVKAEGYKTVYCFACFPRYDDPFSTESANQPAGIK